MNIIAMVVPHREQRYPTVGDWADINGITVFHISDMGNELYARLVLLHELLEQTLCMARGISEQSVTDFDLAYEAARLPGNTDEPGDDERAPYRAEHCFATAIERQFAKELGVDWDAYERAVVAL